MRKISNTMAKRNLFIAWIAALCLALPAKAQFIQQMSLMTPHYYPGEVYFADGHSETFYEVELPRVAKSNLDVRKSPEDKKRTTIEGTDIVTHGDPDTFFPVCIQDLHGNTTAFLSEHDEVLRSVIHIRIGLSQ